MWCLRGCRVGLDGFGDCRDRGLTSRAKIAVSCAAYELVRSDKSDHCLRPECLPDLHFPGDWPGSHYRCVESVVAFLRPQDFCAPFAQVVRIVESLRAPRSLCVPPLRGKTLWSSSSFLPFRVQITASDSVLSFSRGVANIANGPAAARAGS